MELALIKLLLVFVAILVALRLKCKLWQAMVVAIAGTMLLYRIPVGDALSLVWKALSSFGNISVVLILYCITLLQRILERRQQLKLAYQDLSRIFGNNRISATVAPIFIGLLPSAAAAIICGDIVSEAAGDDLSTDEKAFVTSYYRHIPEAFLPTYSSVIIMSQLSGVHVGSFVLGMIPVAIVLYLLGWVFYVRKINKDTGIAPSSNKWLDSLQLLKHLWTLVVIIVLIIAGNVNTLAAIAIVTVAAFFVYGFRVSDLPGLAKDAFEPVLIVNTVLVLVFKEFLESAGVIGYLPEFFSSLPIPSCYAFALIFFFGALVCGSNAIVAFCTVMAFRTVPNSGMPLMVLLMCFSYAAMQLTPVHVCLAIITGYFKSSLGGIIKKTIPVILLFLVFAALYYQLLILLQI